MNSKIALEDFKRNKLINSSILLFIVITALSLSAVFLLVTSLFTSIDNLMLKAKTPDYLQMHQGEIDRTKLNEFATNSRYVADFQCLEFVNFEGEKIIINGRSQEASVQDKGIVYQSEKFDYLLDLDNQIIQVNPGELYLPLMYYKDGSAKIGQKATIAGRDFIIKGFFRDSQMNSNMAGSKRLLLSKEDFDDIKNEGSTEYLIEYLLKDRKYMTDFEREYQENIPYKNGPAITYSMFKMINGLNDGILIVVFILASILISLIAMLCIRFTLMAKLEDEFMEIAVMKAIGLSHKNIKKIYLGSYLLLAGIGSILGYLLAMVFKNGLLENISLYMGKSDMAHLAPFLAILGPILTFTFISCYINRKLNAIKFIKPVEALREGESGLAKNNNKSSQLKSINLTNPLRALVLSDIINKKKLYFTIVILFVLATFLTLTLQHLYTTLNDKTFMSTMGMGDADMSLDIQQIDKIEEKTAAILEELKEDSQVNKVVTFVTKNIEIILPSGKKAFIKPSIGNHKVMPIQYTEGRAPENSSEIALSTFYIDDLEVKLGDEITSMAEGHSMKIVGVYSDISNGGKTAKLVEDLEGSILKTNVVVKAKEGANLKKLTKKYADKYGFSKVSTVKEHIDQAFGGLKSQLKSASLIVLTTSLLVIALVSMLFTKLLLAKDRKDLASLKAMGFSNPELRIKYLISMGLVGLASITIGILLANNLGGFIASGLISSFGVTSLNIVINSFITYLAVPLAILVVIGLATCIVSREIGQIKISESIKE